jgi:hypothetical protein
VIRIGRKDDPSARRRETQLRVISNIPLTMPLGGLDTRATRLEKRDEVVIYALFIEIDDRVRHHASRRMNSSSTPFLRI